MMPIDQEVGLVMLGLAIQLGSGIVRGEVRDAHRRRVYTFEFSVDFQNRFGRTVALADPVPEALNWNYPIHVYAWDDHGEKAKKKIDRLHQLTFFN